MRILLIAGTYPPGHCGIGDYTVQLAQSLSTLPQYLIGILSASQAPESINAIDIIQTEGDWKLISLFRMLRGVSKWKPDWVHIQYPSKAYSQKILPLILPLLLRAIGIKVIVTLHEAYGWRYFYHFVFLTLPAHKIIFVRSNYLNLIPSIFARYLKFKKFRIISNASSLPLSKMTIEEKKALRENFLVGKRRLLVFFGFVYPNKGVELLFQVMNPQSDQLVIAGEVPQLDYRMHLNKVSEENGVLNAVTFTGFISKINAANLLACADAVILPFIEGAGEWNTSVHGARAQGSLVITTAVPLRTHAPDSNMFFVSPGDGAAIKTILSNHAGRKVAPPNVDLNWESIAQAHFDFYAN